MTETGAIFEGTLVDLMKVTRCHGGQAVMQRFKGLQIGVIKEVSPSGQHLGELDKARPEMLDGANQGMGRKWVKTAPALPPFDEQENRHQHPGNPIKPGWMIEPHYAGHDSH